MIEKLLFMAWSSFTITDVLQSWADAGVFAYMLPFLLIFAVVFGILDTGKVLGENKGVHAVIALAVGLLSLQFDIVTDFFATIFPYAGVGISIVLVALILVGLFSSEETKTHRWIFMVLGGIVALIVIFSALSDSGWVIGYEIADAVPAIVAGLILLGIIALVVWGKKK